MLRLVATALAAVLVCTAALAHGGGGGGGGHGHTTYVGGGYYVGGGTIPPPAPEIGDYSQIHTVAVLSGIGQSIQIGTGGIFGTSVRVDIAAWNFDDLTTMILHRYLSQRFAIKDVAYDRAALAALPDTSDATQKYFAALPHDGVDAFVVVHPDGYRSVREGLAVLPRGSTGFPDASLGFDIDIIDAHTLKRIARCFARSQLREGAQPEFAVYYATQIGTVSDKIPPNADQAAKIRAALRLDLAVTLVETIRPLALGVTLPEISARRLIPMPPQDKPLPQIHNVAVISVIGDTVALDYHGAFEKHVTNMFAVPDWKLDAETEADVIAALDKRFTVKPMPADRPTLAKMTITTYDNSLATPFVGLPPTSDVDAYIVVLKRGGIGAAGGMAPGLGFWRQSPLFGGEFTYSFANYAILVIDAQTLKPLSQFAGVASPHRPVEALFDKADNTILTTDATALTPEQSARAHAQFSGIMADSIGETLFRMRMTGMTMLPPEALDPWPPAPPPPLVTNKRAMR